MRLIYLQMIRPGQHLEKCFDCSLDGNKRCNIFAAALALPLFLQDGTAFPKRHSIIFLAFVVIFVTLVVQGLSLPLLIRWLKIKPQDNTAAEEKGVAIILATSTLNFIEQDFPTIR